MQEAVVRSKLVYGLESLYLTDSLQNKLNVFQLKGFRKILKMDTTYVNRANTNEVIYALVETEISKRETQAKQVTQLSEYYDATRMKLYAKLVSAPEDDPIQIVTFDKTTLRPHDYGKKRVGKPKLNWVRETTKLFWDKAVTEAEGIRGRALDLDKQEHVDMIKKTAADWAVKYGLYDDCSRRKVRTRGCQSIPEQHKLQGGGDRRRRLNPFGQVPFR